MEITIIIIFLSAILRDPFKIKILFKLALMIYYSSKMLCSQKRCLTFEAHLNPKVIIQMPNIKKAIGLIRIALKVLKWWEKGLGRKNTYN